MQNGESSRRNKSSYKTVISETLPTSQDTDDRNLLNLQQKCLNIFKDTFTFDAETSTLLQEVKGHLYNRDFAAAFRRKDYLSVYASRWSPSRTLAYLKIFQDVQPHLETRPVESGKESIDVIEKSGQRLVVSCVGGGAGAELIALAGWHSIFGNSFLQNVDVTLWDVADWSSVIHALRHQLVNAPKISQYASSTTKQANVALTSPDKIAVDFQHEDVLELSGLSAKEVAKSAQLVTLMFTLNELYSVSIPKTQAFLSRLTSSASPGSLLLVVDSPGSYSTVSINGNEKKYPMHWLLDVTLLGPPPKANAIPAKPSWEKLISEESSWFRLSPELHFPIKLENMRYQLHLYRRI